MDGKIQQCVCIKFCMKLGNYATKAHEMLHEAFEEHSLSRSAVFEWHSRLKAGQELSVEDDKCSERSSTNQTTENVENNRELLYKDHH
jgi:antirestriction protein ArdC